ncbi:uncharacterized protein SEPMUDRAFT_115510 [Sphaerulina musiva SO2202]|uniref:Uncharacterized protein n=1 Tax=Sphaerulina musiva (strain SO2202) TaxID=692275 RepID=M3CKB7_SPHMS|nr:uncharacterized protein SEPMUDRAFT_115510 [Sphaerulina musiva SO2202]EMF14228.1 hypothetical protein SEPMUDRAFT_115510 [Sphaerulina musiva SO2202]
MAPAISKPASDAPQKPEESGTPYANLLKAQNRQPDAFDRAVMTWQAVTNGISKAGSSIAKLAKKAKNKRDGVPGESFPDPRLQGIGKPHENYDRTSTNESLQSLNGGLQ